MIGVLFLLLYFVVLLCVVVFFFTERINLRREKELSIDKCHESFIISK